LVTLELRALHTQIKHTQVKPSVPHTLKTFMAHVFTLSVASTHSWHRAIQYYHYPGPARLYNTLSMQATTTYFKFKHRQ